MIEGAASTPVQKFIASERPNDSRNAFTSVSSQNSSPVDRPEQAVPRTVESSDSQSAPAFQYNSEGNLELPPKDTSSFQSTVY